MPEYDAGWLASGQAASMLENQTFGDFEKKAPNA